MQKLDDRMMQQTVHEEEIDLRHFVAMVGRRKWTILIVALLAAIAAAFIATKMAPVYRASATVLIESQQANVVSIQDVYGNDTRTQQYYETQFEILKSRPLAEKVIQRLNLLAQPEFVQRPASWQKWKWLPAFARSEKAPIDPLNYAAERYLRVLQVIPAPKTQLVKVSFDSRDPAQAAMIANAHVQAFIESHLEAKEAMTRTATEWMGGRAEELRVKLAESEKRLQEFKEREHLLDIDTGIQSLPTQELNELSSKLIEARRVLSENRNAFEQVNAAQYGSLEEKLALPAVNSDPLIKQFRQARAEAELRVAELARRYGPMHPRMKAVLSERDEAVRSLTSHVESVIGSIRNQQSVLEGQARAIASAMNATKADVQSVSRKESQYRALMQETETNRELYAMFYKRISETREASDLTSANARVIEPAQSPLIPIKPKKSMIVAFTFIAVLIAGIVVALLGELMNTTINIGEDVERRIGLPLLGLVPYIRRPRKLGKRLGREYMENSDPSFDEAIRTLRTAISLSNLEAGHKLIMVTSSCGDEGKTSIACNLALAFAQIERVLLIDGDMRRASVANEFELNSTRPGLAELCAGSANPADCIVHLERANLDILTAGNAPANPQELLGSRRLQEVLQKLRSQYDRIIFDTSPVLPVSDALLLANRADALVYVIKAGTTTVGQVRSGLQMFRRTPITIKGIILNQVDQKRVAEYGSAYVYGSYELRGVR